MLFFDVKHLLFLRPLYLYGKIFIFRLSNIAGPEEGITVSVLIWAQKYRRRAQQLPLRKFRRLKLIRVMLQLRMMLKPRFLWQVGVAKKNKGTIPKFV